MHPHPRGLTPRPPLAFRVLEVADQFLLLRVDRDDRLPGGLDPPDLLIDVPQLGVAVRMGRPVAGLAIGLQTVARRHQQLGDQLAADAMAGLDQTFEIGQKGRIGLHRLLARCASFRMRQ